ncbi:hypothetical protein CDAR_262541 [Caerostris darwini]|uniref:Uncharacterized protein n=1 Tax=Caerostris darwini TaxID=1538125 RepID=A0AAV4TCV5_9ARAC|nr:hypothetical protein CDAR_262541 [Caerostris darwini]
MPWKGHACLPFWSRIFAPQVIQRELSSFDRPIGNVFSVTVGDAIQSIYFNARIPCALSSETAPPYFCFGPCNDCCFNLPSKGRDPCGEWASVWLWKNTFQRVARGNISLICSPFHVFS